MRGIKTPVIGVTLLWLAFQLSPVLGMPFLTLALLILLLIAMVWMVIRVLKDGQPADTTFEEQFYEDRQEKRA